MTENDIEALFYRLKKAEQTASDARYTAREAERNAEFIRNKIYRNLFILFSHDKRYACPKCGQPITVGTKPGVYDDVYPRVRCCNPACDFEDKGLGFLEEYEAVVDWYRRRRGEKNEK